MNFPPAFEFGSVADVHSWFGWVAIFITGLLGLWGVGLAIARREPGRWFRVGTGVAVVAMLVQVGMGLWAFGVRDIQPGNQHLFYGIVILFTLAFAYIYRAQLARRPALWYGLLLLFLMGLGMRGIMTFGQDFTAPAAEAIQTTTAT